MDASRVIAMATEQQKIAYLEERISYELVMLNYSFMRVLTSRPSVSEKQLDFNAYLESFGVHARNLVDFLSEKSRSDCCNASDYVANFEAPDQAQLQQPLLRLEKQVLRVTSLRATDPQEKFDADDARELYAWIVPATLKFQGELDPLYRARFNAL
jgi:hypothetical protein